MAEGHGQPMTLNGDSSHSGPDRNFSAAPAILGAALAVIEEVESRVEAVETGDETEN